MKAKPGPWPPRCQQTLIPKAVKASVPGWPRFGWIYTGCLCYTTCYYSIFAGVMSVQTFCLNSTFFTSQEVKIVGCINADKFTKSSKYWLSVRSDDCHVWMQLSTAPTFTVSCYKFKMFQVTFRWSQMFPSVANLKWIYSVSLTLWGWNDVF